MPDTSNFSFLIYDWIGILDSCVTVIPSAFLLTIHHPHGNNNTISNYTVPCVGM